MKFNILGPFVIADSSSSESNTSNGSKVSLEELDPLAVHHITLTNVNVLKDEGASSLMSELLEKTTMIYN